MTLFNNTAEGTASGTVVTTTNSATGGTAFTVIAGASGVTFDSTRAAHGTQSYKIVGAGGTNNDVEWNTLSSTQAVLRFYIYFTANPSATLRIGGFYGAANARLLMLNLTTAGKLQPQNSAGTPLGTSTASIPLSTWVRVEAVVDTSANTGSVLFASLDAAATETVTAAGLSLASAPINGARFGHCDTGTDTSTWWIDDLGAQDGTTTLLGASAAPLAATVGLSPTSGTVPFTCTATGATTGGIGTPINYSWAWGDGATTAAQTSNVATHNYTVAGSYTVTMTAVNT